MLARLLWLLLLAAAALPCHAAPVLKVSLYVLDVQSNLSLFCEHWGLRK